MNSLVSIIVPAYNCEKYIGTCIESIVAQSYKNIEVIIIDDGSIDNTYEIIKKYITKDKRIKYFTQENSGPSVARNKGIEKSNGEYLIFVDSDDIIEKIYVEKLLNRIKSNSFDIACCGYIDKSKYGVVKLNDFWINKDILNKQEFLECVCNGVGGVLWSKIFRKDIIIENNIRMNPKIFMSEDLIFILEYCKYINKVGVINEYLYHYNRLNDSSISSNIDINYLENYILLINKISELLTELKFDFDKINKIKALKVQDLINKVLISETYKYLELKDKDKFVSNLKLILENDFIKKYKNQISNNNILNRISNILIINKKYVILLYLSILIIYLRRIKDKVLRR